MTKKVFLLIAFSFVLCTSNAQDPEVSTYPDNSNTTKSYNDNSGINQTSKAAKEKRWLFGGFLSFAFWNEGTDLLIAPKAYYKFSPMFMLGFGLTYIYSDGVYRETYQDNSYEIYNYHSNSIGGSFAIIFRPLNALQLSAEFEPLHTTRRGEYNRLGVDNFSRVYWDTGLFLGASYVTGNFAFGLRYNILYDSYTSPYASALTPVVSFYF